MKPSIFLTVFSIAGLYAGDSSQISGTVVDQSNRLVASAIVECGGHRAIASSDGRFTLQDVSNCDATITKAGFETAHAALSSAGENRIELTLAVLSDKVVVSATRTLATVEESGVSATIFTRRDFDIRDTPPVLDLLRDVPGMAVMSTSRRGGVTSLFTRGGASTGTLVLLDGVPLNEAGGQLDLAHLSTAGLDRIEAVRGPESALFGAEAAAGVVQLFTARGDVESAIPHGQVSYERGNLQTDRWIASVNGGLFNRIDYSLTAEQFHTVGTYQNDFYRNSNGTANIGWRITPSTQVRGVFREYDSITGTPNQVAYGIFDLAAHAQNRDSSLVLRVDDSRGEHFAQTFSSGYHRLGVSSIDDAIGGPYNIAALVRNQAGPQPRVYFEGLADPSLAAAQIPSGLTLVKRNVMLYPYSSTSLTDRKDAGYQGTYTHAGGALVFGYQYDREEGAVSGVNAIRDNNGFFIHEQYRIGRRLYLTAGARLEHSNTFGNKFAPRASATFAITQSTFLRASAGRGITEPSLLQNFAHESYFVGNPALRPEKTTSYDIGIVQELFGRRIRAEATAFRNSFEDLIVYDSGVYPGTWRNIDRSWGRGFETTFTVRPMRYVQVSANWTRLYTKITRTTSTASYSSVGAELLRRPKNSGSAWISVTPRRWSFIVGGRFTGERQDSDFLFGITRNPGYGTVYASASYHLTKHVTPFFRVDNLLNERYQEVLGYSSLTRNGVGGVRLSW